MEVLKLKEKEDGSAELQIELTSEEEQMLLSYAITNILKESFEKHTRKA
jgi:hypothetical protein